MQRRELFIHRHSHLRFLHTVAGFVEQSGCLLQFLYGRFHLLATVAAFQILRFTINVSRIPDICKCSDYAGIFQNIKLFLRRNRNFCLSQLFQLHYAVLRVQYPAQVERTV